MKQREEDRDGELLSQSQGWALRRKHLSGQEGDKEKRNRASEGGASQSKALACVKTLRYEHTWHVSGARSKKAHVTEVT